MPYRVINIYYSVTCYTNHINSTRIQSIASMALMVFPDDDLLVFAHNTLVFASGYTQIHIAMLDYVVQITRLV